MKRFGTNSGKHSPYGHAHVSKWKRQHYCFMHLLKYLNHSATKKGITSIVIDLLCQAFEFSFVYFFFLLLLTNINDIAVKTRAIVNSPTRFDLLVAQEKHIE